MQTSSQPKLLPVPFANGGSKQDIPNDSQIGITAGRASYTDGFPPLTRTPLAAGGVPPFGTDFNGVLNDITAAIRWSQAGAGYPFDATFNTAITGFPKGAKIPNSTFDGFWLNITDGNSVNPENTTSALTGWVPTGFYGVTALTGLSGSSVTLTTLQAGRDRITLAGTLTANINLVVPAWVKRWEIVNNCTGAFSVTVKTPSGTGIPVPAGLSMTVYGDGTNIVSGAAPGTLIGPPVVISTTGTYIPTAGTKKIKVRGVGGGGAGGGTGASQSNSVRGGGGGGAGTYGELWLTNVPASVVCTIGAAGAGVSGSAGGNGGDTVFGSYMTLPGGKGGELGINLTAAGRGAGGGSIADAATGANTSVRGQIGGDAFAVSATTVVAGNGGSTPLGSGAPTAAATSTTSSAFTNTGVQARGYGSGGGGGTCGIAGAASVGGAGSPGILIIEEYA